MTKPLLFILCCLFTTLGFSQIELQPNPSNINSGTFTFKYGEFGDYSIFDPFSNPNLYLYTGLQTDADPVTWDYNDGEFTLANLGQMIPLTYDNTLGYYVATFNPKTRQYIEAVSQNLVSVPNGIQVYDWYFLITTDDLSRQSADLKGSDYGFNAATLTVNDFLIGEDVIVLNGSLKFVKSGAYSIKVYDILGKLIQNDILTITGTVTYDLGLKRAGIYIVKLTLGQTTRTVKLLKH
ncbi:T9SS type A sorting domain-containing protein [uncultured Psychroserpens sp.]|uniref:T9SS type A sorting domain-containing protein n=1 Tax=uncultured Psychroserpens sp. TaxID=255436 RepID=UPI0026273BA9|nr:T9SS type A sorting domain-containing protein [uncultured Psychroserpens sp.]